MKSSGQGRQLHKGRILRAVLPAVVCIAMFGVIALVWDFYYDLNDDTMMAAILSGAYTGEPALRNIQSYFPLTLVLGGLQRLIGSIPWYGIFLAAMPFVCLYLVLHRIGTITMGPVQYGAGQGCGTGGTDIAPDGGASAGDAGAGKQQASAGASFSCISVEAIVCSAVAVMLFAGMLLYHLVFVQYSVVVGIMGATAAFLFLTMEPQESVRAWIREILPQLILIGLGFLLRSEMMLFISPFIALAFLIRLLDMDMPVSGKAASDPSLQRGSGDDAAVPGGETEGFAGKKGKKARPLSKISAALLTMVLVLAVLGVCQLGNDAGYASPEWQEFYAFFDARTELYDFQKLPEYEGNEEFYESIGLDEAEAALILNYNFGIDEEIDAEVIEQIAAYAAEKTASEETVRERLKNALWDYQHTFSSDSEQPYNTVAAVLYIMAFAAVLAGFTERLSGGKDAAASAQNRKGVGVHASGGVSAAEKYGKKKALLYILLRIAELGILFAGRSVLLLYLYYNNRPVVRLTHSIYLAEAVILVWMVWESLPDGFFRGSKGDDDFAGRRKEAAAGRTGAKSTSEAKPVLSGKSGSVIRVGRSSDRVVHGAFAAVLAVLFLYAAAVQISDVNTEDISRETVNGDWLAFMEYCEANPEKVYFTDVYSTVSFSEKIFDGEEEAVNYVLMGGWVSKSPLEEQKFEYLGLTSADVESDAPKSTGAVMQESLLENERCYYAARSTSDISWLTDYYACKGIDIEVTAVDAVGDFWIIYDVREAGA